MVNLKNMESQISVEGLSKSFPLKKQWLLKKKGRFQEEITAVDHISFSVKKGQAFGIVGESGSGKSTLAHLIMGILQPTGGIVRIGNQAISHLKRSEQKKVRRNIQMVFQDPYSSLNSRMKIRDIIAEPLENYFTLSRAELDHRVTELLESVGLKEEHKNRYPHQFSGGQRQRIGIARALALKPDVLVFDEAVSALDVSTQAQILNLLQELKNLYQLTYIFIGHGMPAVKFISDEIAVMYHGRIIEQASKQQLFERPMHPYTIALLDSVPSLDLDKRKTTISPKEIELDDQLRFYGTGCPLINKCSNATETCKTSNPGLFETKTGHKVACHHPVNT